MSDSPTKSLTNPPERRKAGRPKGSPNRKLRYVRMEVSRQQTIRNKKIAAIERKLQDDAIALLVKLKTSAPLYCPTTGEILIEANQTLNKTILEAIPYALWIRLEVPTEAKDKLIALYGEAKAAEDEVNKGPFCKKCRFLLLPRGVLIRKLFA